MATPGIDYYACPSGSILAAGRGVVPAWAPAAGQIKQISYNAGAHPLGAGAVLSEINPATQPFNPYAPDGSIFFNGYGWHTWYGYCGAAFNTDTRQIVHYGTGHVSCNVTAPLCFDLNDLRWKWLDTPLPFDCLGKLLGVAAYPTQAQVEQFYPPEQYNYDWGDVSGDWAGWPSGYGQPGKIQPLPTHSYATQVHIPASAMGNTKGGYLMFGSYEGVINASGNANGCHLFDFDTQSWSRGNNVWPGGSSYGRGAATDYQTGKVIVFGSWSQYEFRVFDPATKLWATRTATGTPAYTSSGDHHGNLIHAAANLYVIPGGRTASDAPCNWETYLQGVTYRFHVAPVNGILGAGSFTLTELTVNVQGTWPLNDQGNNYTIGWTYCPVDRCLYAINGVHGSNKYWKLSPPAGALSQNDYLTGTWTLTDHTFASGTLQSPGFTRSQMYNRMKWDALSRSFVFWVNSNTGPVQAWRPEGIA